MKAFLNKRPGISVLTLLAVFATGSVLAWQTRTSPHQQLVPLSMTQKKLVRKPSLDWRKRLDLGRSMVQGGELVQQLKDGSRVTYTLDPDLQQWATSFMKKYELPYAGMVLFDVKSGKVRVMAGHSTNNHEMGAEDLCLTPWAPAASIYKLVTASALLDSGVPADTTVCYHGGLRGLRKHHIVDNPSLDTRCKTLSYAVAKSVNPIVAKLATRYLSRRSMQRWSRRFGFNRPIPFELTVQPSKAYIPADKLARAKVAAGFWHTETSVLHGALIGAVAGNEGLMRWPRIVESVRKPDGRVVIPTVKEDERVMSRVAAQRLARAMASTTTIGTARRGFHSRRGVPFLKKTQVAGKTGSLSRRNPFLHYNWFVGFAPAQRPEVAFAVLLGNPAKWRIKAHSAARMLLDQYFRAQRRRLEEQKSLQEQKQREVASL
jgi:cell division protein FtsI/penicillin-binding protein 2